MLMRAWSSKLDSAGFVPREGLYCSSLGKIENDASLTNSVSFLKRYKVF